MKYEAPDYLPKHHTNVFSALYVFNRITLFWNHIIFLTVKTFPEFYCYFFPASRKQIFIAIRYTPFTNLIHQVICSSNNANVSWNALIFCYITYERISTSPQDLIDFSVIIHLFILWQNWLEECMYIMICKCGRSSPDFIYFLIFKSKISPPSQVFYKTHSSKHW